MKRRTKIVCTLGPATSSKAKIKELISAGMNVARINCSHGDWPTRNQWIEWIRELSPEVAPVAILVDLQGPKFRLGILESSQLVLQVGQIVSIGPQPGAALPLTQENIVKTLAVGDHILLGDGEVEIKLVEKVGENFEAKAITGGTVKSRQGVTLVNKVFETDCLTPQDRDDVERAIAADVDFIALSYVHCAEDMAALRKLIAKRAPDIKLCAKVETREGLKAIREITEASDLIMVARGDLGLQMPIEDVPVAQKQIIATCREMGKPVITATQMLESMIVNARPTRAEATDVANAILDGTDAVMLSGETAAGAYPIEAVEVMSRISEKAEAIFNHANVLREYMEEHAQRVPHTQAVAYSVCQLASQINPKAIVSTTTSGQTAQLVSKFRPKTPILCATWNRKTQCQLAVVWGCEAIYTELPSTTDEIIRHAIDGFASLKRLKSGDLVIVTAGIPAGLPGHTNLILTQTV